MEPTPNYELLKKKKAKSSLYMQSQKSLHVEKFTTILQT